VNCDFPLGIGVLQLKYESKRSNLAWIFFSSLNVVLAMGTNKKITARAQLFMILVATAYPSPITILSIFSIV